MDYLLVAVCMLLSTQGWSTAQNIPVDIQPREQVVKEGDAVQFICRVGQPIEFCRIELPNGQGVNLKPNLQATNLGIEYFGEGFQAGQCGLKLQRTDSTHNGNFKCTMAIASSVYEAAGAMKLTVARPPQAPELRKYNRYDELNEGETFEATCIVRNGRPAANLTWFIGDDLVTHGLDAPKIVTEQTDLFSVAQNLSRPVSWQDHGKKLRCVAQHIGSVQDEAVETDIRVRFPPQPMMGRGRNGPVEQYGFEEGREGVVTVEVAANPQPSLKWRINGHELVERESSSEYEVEEAQQIESGKWAARLRINKVSAADIDKDFKLTATNELGEQIYTVKISTSPGAAETDLGIVGIVGIVIAVLIIFLLVLLVCFARITGRWCFAARREKESRAGSEAQIDPEIPAKTGNDNPTHHDELETEVVNGTKINGTKQNDKDTPV